MIKFLESVVKIFQFNCLLFGTIICIISTFVEKPYFNNTGFWLSIVALTVLIKYLLVILEDVIKSE
jgi:hypothetical protein